MSIRLTVVGALFLVAADALAEPVLSVPSAPFLETRLQEVVTLKSGGDLRKSEIRLAPLLADEIQPLIQHNQETGKAMQIGVDRSLPPVDPGSPFSSGLKWTPLAAGGQAALLAVTSPGARALRLGMAIARLDNGVEMRFFGSNRPGEILGPVRAAEARARQPVYWSPVTDGETLTLEIYLPPGLNPESVVFDLPQLSHLVRNARGDRQKDIGDSGSCEYDVACVSNPSQALLTAQKTVAKMVYTKGGKSYLCTGTLLNDTDASTYVPYFFSANHCISDQATASTLNTYWFFEASTCGGTSAPNTVQKTGGATLLHTSDTTDITFLRLNDTPPGGTYFSGWDAATVASGADVIGLHHPAGDLKKFSRGTSQGYAAYNGAGSFISVQWSAGVTEGGSSGSGLFTLNNSDYRLRGGLKGGSASCDNPQGLDKYSRLDQDWTYIRPYLVPTSAVTTADKTAIEFYNTALAHYFITVDAGEAAAIDAGGAGPGWSRTGGTFKVWGSQVSGSVPVCRFYGSVSPGPNSHFFTADASECAALQAMQSTIPASMPRWNYETTAYYAFASQGGVCASDKTPIHRFYNNGNARGTDSNHRLTSDPSVRSSMEEAGWVYEGVTMCGGS